MILVFTPVPAFSDCLPWQIDCNKITQCEEVTKKAVSNALSIACYDSNMSCIEICFFNFYYKLKNKSFFDKCSNACDEGKRKCEQSISF
jgi:hypothetical protein